jgi:hypothetical protein
MACSGIWETQAEKVVPFILLISIILITFIVMIIFIIAMIPITLIISIFGRFVAISVSDHVWMAYRVWKEKSEAIAQTVDALGYQFLPAIRAGWLTYNRKTYPDREVVEGYAIGQGVLVLDG